MSIKMDSTDSSKLNIYYQNVRGLRSKTLTFYRNICLNSYDVIILTETWIVDSIASSELFDDRYIVWRRDRDLDLTGQTRGGGVLIAIRRDITATLQPQYQSSAEDLWLTIALKQRNNNTIFTLNLCVIYVCKQNLGFSFSQQLHNFLSKLDDVILKKPDDAYLIIGDFNLSSIIWEPITDSPGLLPSNVCSSDEQHFVDELNVHDLRQYNGIVNNHGRVLDLVLSNEDVLVLECVDPLVPIDPHHKALLIEAQINDVPCLTPRSYVRYLYNKGDYESINKAIFKLDWGSEFSNLTLEEAVTLFYLKLECLKNKYIPRKNIASESYPKWYSPALKKVLKEKYKYLKKYKTYKNKTNQQSYMLLRDRAKLLEKQCYLNYISTVENSIEKNPKYFWSYIKSRSKFKGIPNTLKYLDSTVTAGDDICNSFSAYFHSTFLSPGTILDSPSAADDDLSDAPLVSDISEIEIDTSHIAKLLSQLDPSKSAGPDNVSPFILINCAESIAVPVSLLFQKSLSHCAFPRIWKSAFVTPVHKKGSRTDVVNYRPISKLCILAKVFERVIYNQVYAAVKNSFHGSQHGFLRGRSTASNLILLNDYITEAMDAGNQVDVVYTDYSKAFDRIHHKTLLHKLFRIGIRGNLYRWFSSYIDRRTQAVVVSNYVSSWVTIPSGVPQGSLLGPLLFTIFINDISSCFLNSHLLCFADDMKIYTSITSPEDVINLQADLSRLDLYCTLNKLDLNPAKCSVVTYSRKRNAIPSAYTLKNEVLVKNMSIRDLGVIHDSKLLFDKHIDNIVSRASKSLGFVMRSCAVFNKAKTFKILYCTFVRSVLEYVSQVWNPRYDKYVMRIEQIQKKFVRYLCYRLKIPYTSDEYLNLCKKFHLLPLSTRREIADITYLLKIMSNSIDCPELLNKIKINVPYKPIRFNPLLSVPSVSTNYRQHSYICRTSKNYNSVSKRLDIDLFCTSIASARRQLSAEFFV